MIAANSRMLRADLRSVIGGLCAMNARHASYYGYNHDGRSITSGSFLSVREEAQEADNYMCIYDLYAGKHTKLTPVNREGL